MDGERSAPTAAATDCDRPAERDREPLLSARRIVVKVGTRVLGGEDRRFDESRLQGLVAQVAPLARAGREILLVSSGAVGLGAQLLGLAEPPERLEDRQACAAVGQARLMQLYQEAFRQHGVVSAQVLLTEADFHDRRRYLNLRSTLHNLLRRHVVPVINENDTVSVAELEIHEQGARRVFGDNDRLSALVATKLEAGLLVLITDVEGVYDRDPKTDPAARLLPRVEDPESVVTAAGGSSGWGRGGMRSKIEAAQVAARSGCHAVIASGREHEPLLRVVQGEPIGTWFPASTESLDARRRWIAFAARSSAVLTLDDGAVAALRDGRRSLLAPGVRRIDGTFRRGEVVELRSESGRLVGRGMTSCDTETARVWGAGGNRIGDRGDQPLIRRDRLVLEEWLSTPPDTGSAAAVSMEAPPVQQAPAAGTSEESGQ